MWPQIDLREDYNPHHIDKVPVQPGVREKSLPERCSVVWPRECIRDGQQDEACRDVQAVKTGKCKECRSKQVTADRDVLLNQPRIFGGLAEKKKRAQTDSGEQPSACAPLRFSPLDHVHPA